MAKNEKMEAAIAYYVKVFMESFPIHLADAIGPMRENCKEFGSDLDVPDDYGFAGGHIGERAAVMSEGAAGEAAYSALEFALNLAKSFARDDAAVKAEGAE